MHQIHTICVCGAGTMGTGIAQVAVQAGYATILFDLNEAALEKSRITIENNRQSLLAGGKITVVEKEVFDQRLSFTSNLTDCIADLVVEAIIENASAKINLFNQLAEINPINTIFATNTSSIAIGSIASKFEHPYRLAGMHFFNPAPVMKLVELVQGEQTSEAVIKCLSEVCKKMGKVPVVCKDAPGFIVNRVARHYYLEALLLVENGEADILTVDKVMEASGFKMGPFKLMDLIGIDINYSVTNHVWDALGKPDRLRPSAVQAEKLSEGALGRKTGKGFYEY